LLEDNFGEPDAKRVCGIPPGECSPVKLIPFNDFFGEISWFHPLDYQIFSIFIFKSAAAN
jgi:hypothetical protein